MNIVRRTRVKTQVESHGNGRRVPKVVTSQHLEYEFAEAELRAILGIPDGKIFMIEVTGTKCVVYVDTEATP